MREDAALVSEMRTQQETIMTQKIDPMDAAAINNQWNEVHKIRQERIQYMKESIAYVEEELKKIAGENKLSFYDWEKPNYPIVQMNIPEGSI